MPWMVLHRPFEPAALTGKVESAQCFAKSSTQLIGNPKVSDSLKFFGSARWLYGDCRGVAGVFYPGLDTLKELYSVEESWRCGQR